VKVTEEEVTRSHTVKWQTRAEHGRYEVAQQNAIVIFM
jgi:hypothetical protein